MIFNLYKKIVEFNDNREEKWRLEQLWKDKIYRNKARFDKCINYAKQLIKETERVLSFF